MSTFEDNLWRELVCEHHAEDVHRQSVAGGRKRRRLLAGTGLSVAVGGTAAALVLSAGTAAPAFAVTTNTNGTVTVTITQIAGLSGANAQLAALGVRARAVPITQGCTATLNVVPKTPPPSGTSVPRRKFVV